MAKAATVPKLLRMPEVSELTGVPMSTLRYMRQARTGPESFILAGRVVYPADAVAAWIEESRSAAS